jgi:DNA-binding CsgD family transcriptional regulator
VDENSALAETPLLTPRQLSILCLIARGWTTVQIAAELYISHHTVSQHIADMLRRFGARSRSELVARAFVAGHFSVAEGWPPHADPQPPFHLRGPGPDSQYKAVGTDPPAPPRDRRPV